MLTVEIILVAMRLANRRWVVLRLAPTLKFLTLNLLHTGDWLITTQPETTTTTRLNSEALSAWLAQHPQLELTC